MSSHTQSWGAEYNSPLRRETHGERGLVLRVHVRTYDRGTAFWPFFFSGVFVFTGWITTRGSGRDQADPPPSRETLKTS